MKVIKKEKEPLFNENVLVDYYTIYVVDKLPKEREFFELDNKKGYVVSIQEDEETKSHIAYLEKNLDDWNNQIQEICDAIYLRKKSE